MNSTFRWNTDSTREETDMKNCTCAMVAPLGLLLLFVSGCGAERGTATPADPPRQPAAEARHAPAAVEPGSHEDWCGEHEVPESQCTRCNPSLVPAFQASGDWCAEHGLPESQCRICHPDLVIERPAKKAEGI
jgi:hypothetical protein